MRSQARPDHFPTFARFSADRRDAGPGLHRQAIATANDLAVRQKAIKVDIAKDARRRKIEAWLFVAGAIIVALGAVLALLAMM